MIKLMTIPLELQYIVISFIPQSSVYLVCKDWNNEIKNIQKNSVNIIGLWYKTKLIKSQYFSTRNILRYYIICCPEENFIEYPEYIVINLRLNKCILSVLPSISLRKRSEVRDWILNIYSHIYGQN